MIHINYMMVVLAAVANFIIGFMFHGPLFGKVWIRLANIHPTGNEKFKDMIPQMAGNFVVNLICAYVLAMFIFVTQSYYDNVGNVVGGMGIAFWAWFGFIFTSSSINVIWMGQSKKLWMFEAAASLVSFLAMGAILARS